MVAIPAGMFKAGREVKAKTGSFTWTQAAAAGTNIVVTGVGFTPKIIFFTYSRAATTDGLTKNNHGMAFGYGISASDRGGVAVLQTDASDNTDNSRYLYNDAVVVRPSSTGNAGALDLVSMDSDGFTLVIDTALSPVTMTVHYLAIGGSSVTNAAGGTMTEPGATGTQDITTVGFQPELVLFYEASVTALGIGSGMALGIGAANTAAEQFVTWGQMGDVEDNSNNQRGYLRYDQIFTQIATSNPLTAQASFSSMLSNGFRLNWTARSSTRVNVFSAIKGIKSKIGNFNTRTDTTNFSVTGLGFTPKAVIFIGTGIAESASGTPSGGWEYWSIGFATGASLQNAKAMRQTYAVITTNIVGASETDNVYLDITTNAATYDATMALVSLDTDGFTLVMTDADTAATPVSYIAIG